MSEEFPKTIEIVKKKKSTMRNIFDEYILWFAMPLKAKESMGIETDIQFAEFYEITARTLRNWKDRPEFEDQVRRLRKKWAFEKTGHVLEGIYRSAVKGNDKSQKLWLQVFEGFTEKTENTQTIKIELSTNDIRFVIQQLPEEYHEKYYGYLREIFDTAQALRFAGQLRDVDVPSATIEEVISEEADNDAHLLPGKRVNVVAKSNQRSLCEDMAPEWGGAKSTS